MLIFISGLSKESIPEHFPLLVVLKEAQKGLCQVQVHLSTFTIGQKKDSSISKPVTKSTLGLIIITGVDPLVHLTVL